MRYRAGNQKEEESGCLGSILGHIRAISRTLFYICYIGISGILGQFQDIQAILGAILGLSKIGQKGPKRAISYQRVFRGLVQVTTRGPHACLTFYQKNMRYRPGIQEDRNLATLDGYGHRM